MKMQNIFRYCVGLLFLALYALTWNTAAQAAVTSPVLQSIAVLPINVVVPNGLSQQFTAMGHYSDGSTKDITTSVTWMSADPNRVTISPHTGLAKAVTYNRNNPSNPYQIPISATLNGMSGQTMLTTVAPMLHWITVTPTNPTVAKGLTQQFTAMGYYSDGSTQNLTNSSTWVSSNPAVATINDTGLATVMGNSGGTTINAYSSMLVSNNATLTAASPASH